MSDFATWLSERDNQAAASNASLANAAVRSSPDKPDQVAADMRTAHDFARETGLPVPPRTTVSAYRTDFERKIEEARNSTILSNAPKLSEWLLDPNNAGIAKDDLPGLSWWENSLIVPRGIASAVPAFGEGFYGLAAAATGLGGENAVSRYLSDRAIGARAVKENVAGPTGGWFGQQVQGAAQSVGLMAPGLAASVATGGAALPGVAAMYLTPGVVQQGGASAQKALDQGKSPTQALYYGALDAAAEALFERLPMGRLIGDIASGAGFGKILAHQLATEVPTEVATTLFQNLNEYANLNPDKPFKEFIAEQPAAIRDTIAQTILATAGVSIGAKGVQATLGKVADHVEKKVEADNAAARVAMFQELAGQAANSKTRARLPEAFRSFVDAATKDGPVENVFVPADQFVQYFQGLGMDPHAVAGSLEGVTAEDLDAALASGGDVMIPTASYATHLAGSEHDAFFLENMRLDPSEMTPREAFEFNARERELRDAAYAEEEAARLDDEARRTYEEELRDTLISRDRAAGRATDVARTEVEPIVAFYRTQAERSGMTLGEFMRRYPVMQIEGNRPEGMKFKSVDDLTMALAAARTAKQEAVKRGPSLLEWISDRGGITDPGGELAARDAAVISRGRGKKALRLARTSAGDMASTGRKYGVDEVARAAVEAGYMADHPAVAEYRAAMEHGDAAPDLTGALWEAIDAELRGTPQHVANVAADEAAARNAHLDEIEAYLNSIGVSLDNTDEEIRAAHEASRQYAQSAASIADVEAVAAASGVDLSVSEGASAIILHKIAAGQRGEGAGTRVMEALTAYADRSGRRIVLTPSTDFGGSSVKRLAEFYKRFGFVQNKGRSKDFSVSEGMYRDPARSFEQSDGSAPRGMMQRGANGETLVRYFAGADLSTLLHESGHVFLTIMQDMANRGEAHAVSDLGVMREWWRGNTSDVIKDARKAMPDVAITPEDVAAYLDTGSTGDVMKDGAVDVGTQEQFARALETYLMEGKAPSLSLRDVFERVAMWLTRIYKRLTSLDVTVSDDMRRVFDRMLATDEEIAAARSKSGDVGISATAEQLGMTEDEFARFKTLRSRAEDDAKARVRAEAMKPIVREQEAKFKAERERVRADVERQIKRMPAFRAMQELRFGKTFEGDEVGAIKLDRAAIAREYGDGYVPLLPGATKDGKGHRNAVFANEGGMHPDVVADMYGFETGRDLLDALVRAPDMGEAIKAETDRIMRDEHGDMLYDGTAEQVALEAVHGDRKGEWIAAELKAAVEVAGSDRGLTHKEARESARRSLRGVRVRDVIRSSRYLAAERKAANEAVTLSGMLARDRLWMDAARRRVAAKAKAAMEGKSFDAVATQIDKANASTLRQNETAASFIETKRRHLINHMLYDESRKVADAVDRIQDRVGKLDKADKSLGKTVDIDHVKAARAIAARFGLARADTTFDFDAWQQQLAFEDVVAHSALTTAIDAYRSDARHFKDLTVAELDAVSDAIENLLSAGRRLKELDVEGKKVDRRAAIDELVTVLVDRGSGANPALARKLKVSEKAKVGALSILSSLRRMEDWTRQMDGGEQGPFTRYLVRPVMDAVDRYRADRTVRLKSLLDIINGRKEKLFGRAIAAPELGYTFENKAEFLHAVLHTGNESNLEKLLIGRGWSQGYVDQQQAVTGLGRPRVTRTGDPIMTRGRLDTSRWDAFMSRMIDEGSFTAEDVATVNAIWKLMESTKRPAQAAHKRIFGFYFKEIETKGYDTSVGRLEGGYVPAIADTDASNDGQLRADQQAMEQQQTSFMFPTTGSGFTKSRVQNYQTPLALNLMLLPAHLDKVLRFTHLEPVIRQTASLVNDRSFRDAINSVDKTIASSLIVPWLQRTAQQAVEAAPTTQAGRAAATVFRGLRKRVGLHTMMANVINTAQQITGLSSAAVLVKPGLLKAAMVRFMKGDAEAMRTEAFEASPFMAARIKDAARETQARIQDAVVEPTVFGDVKLWIERHGYFMQTAFQNVVDVIVWHAAYDQAAGKGMSHADATFEADSIIRRSMSAMDPESISMFETGSAFTRMFTMFYSYFNGQANLVGGEIAQAMRVGGWAGHRRMFFVYLLGVAIPAIVGEAIVQASKGTLGDEDDDGYLDDMLELLLGSQLRYLAGAVPIVGSITTAMFNTFNGKPYDDRLSTSPVVSTSERAIRAPASIVKAMQGGDKSAAVGDTLSLLGLITGVPLGWLAKPAGYATNVAEGDANPKGAADIIRGVLSGRDGSEAKK